MTAPVDTTAVDTLAARLSRVAAACHRVPQAQVVPRVGVALGANGLAVTATSQETTFFDGYRAAVRVAVTVQSPDGAVATFSGVGHAEGRYAVADAILCALQALWLAALGLDLFALEPDATDYARDASAWEAHLREGRDPAHVRNSWRKHRASFEAAGVAYARKGAAIDWLVNRRGSRGEAVTPEKLHGYLDAPPENDARKGRPST